MAIQDTPEMGDWLKTVDELLVAHGTDDPCAVARAMRDAGQTKAPIFRRLVQACKEHREGKEVGHE